MQKILVIETNQATYGKKATPTGLWLGETTEFVLKMHEAGYQVDYVSPQGGYVPVDPRSLKYANKESIQLYQSRDFERRALAETHNPAELTAEDYHAIYYAGGHGAMWDFVNNQPLQQLAEKIYRNGGYITSVCHGIAGLFNLRLPNGNFLIKGRQITGFTTTEEMLAGKYQVVPFLNQPMATKRGAQFVKKHAYSSFVVQDGRLITGQNPFSAQAVAEKLLHEIKPASTTGTKDK